MSSEKMENQKKIIKPEEVEGKKIWKCPDCDTELKVPEDVMIGEIITCPSCGLDFKFKEDGTLEEFVITGEDFGE